MDNIFRFRNRFSKSALENLPKFAYNIMYNKQDLSFTGNLYFTPKKLIRLDNSQTLYVDEHLKDEWIIKLNNIKNIEIRSTCEGHDSKYITHIIFRPNIQDLDYIKTCVIKLNKLPFTKSKYDIDNRELYRIGIVTRNWYRKNADNSKWESWWENSVNSLDEMFN